METTLFAQPYADAVGFYFTSIEDYEAKYAQNFEANQIEEYEIQFIDGSDIQTKLFSNSQISQANLEIWFESLEDLDKEQSIKINYLLDNQKTISEALEKMDEVNIYKGSLRDYAEELFLECHSELPESVIRYIDFESFGRDLELGGDVVTNDEYIITNNNEF